MRVYNMPKCHCGENLSKKRGEHTYYCRVCKCIYRLVIVMKSVKCACKELESNPAVKKSLGKLKREQKKKRKRRKK